MSNVMICVICGKKMREGRTGCYDSPDLHIHYECLGAQITVCGKHTEDEVTNWIREKLGDKRFRPHKEGVSRRPESEVRDKIKQLAEEEVKNR